MSEFMPRPRPVVLLVEDHPDARRSTAEWLHAEGHDVYAVASGHEALRALDSDVDAIVLDYGLPDIDGFEVLRRVQARRDDVPAIMLTGQGSVTHAVEAMKLGAFHYVTKPVDLRDLAAAVREAVAVRQSRRLAARAADVASDDATARILGVSRAMEQVRAAIGKLGRTAHATVLVTGESGTGKDLAAHALHLASPRAPRPFVNVTCTALPNALLESELFGHERGAFTDAKSRHRGLLEQAEGGTLFLDEVGDMNPALQAKLLRVLEDKRYRRVGGTTDLVADVRIVAATNVDLPEAVRAGRFREDLYYRLAVLALPMPPLRDRPGDVELLADHFLAKFAAAIGREGLCLTSAARRVLTSHGWPGNVRELRNVLERAAVLADDVRIGIEDLHLPGVEADAHRGVFALPPDGVDIRKVEREWLLQALERTRGNVTHAARLLGMNRDQVRYRIQKFGLRDAMAPEHESS
jgi:DNA-binding NtrC family response regulator